MKDQSKPTQLACNKQLLSTYKGRAATSSPRPTSLDQFLGPGRLVQVQARPFVVDGIPGHVISGPDLLLNGPIDVL